MPSAPCFRMNAFWASENRDAFIVLSVLPAKEFAPKTLTKSDPVWRPQSKSRMSASSMELQAIPSAACRFAQDASCLAPVARSGILYSLRQLPLLPSANLRVEGNGIEGLVPGDAMHWHQRLRGDHRREAGKFRWACVSRGVQIDGPRAGRPCARPTGATSCSWRYPLQPEKT